MPFLLSKRTPVYLGPIGPDSRKKLIERRQGDARHLLQREPVAAGFGEQDEAVQAAGQIAGKRRGAVAQRDLARRLAALDGAQKNFLQPAETLAASAVPVRSVGRSFGAPKSAAAG